LFDYDLRLSATASRLDRSSIKYIGDRKFYPLFRRAFSGERVRATRECRLASNSAASGRPMAPVAPARNPSSLSLLSIY